jgi:hypothetical protein
MGYNGATRTMKKDLFIKTTHILLFCFLLSAFLPIAAQQCFPPNTKQQLNANNIRALFKTNGFHFFNEKPDFEVPKGSGKTTIFTANLWLGGLDEQENLNVLASTYGIQGRTLSTGPITTGNAQISASWYDRFWMLSKEEIEYHKTHYTAPNYTMPDAIATWPAHGRTEYGESFFLAPFIDVSGKGYYTPSLGDYPDIRGDYAIYFINNDWCNEYIPPDGTLPTNIEILCMAYAYNTMDSALYNTIFISYLIRNKSANNYKDFYLGFFSDFDIGDGYDDFIGCDSLLNLGYGYNGMDIDGIYGANPPAQGVMFLNQKMSAFLPQNNTTGVTGAPTNSLEAYNNLKGVWKNGVPITYGGNGYNTGSTNYTKYVYTGDPVTKTGWTEFTPKGPGSFPNSPGDRCGLLSSGPFNLPIGESICLDLALPWARDYVEDNPASVALLKERANTIQQFYNNQNYTQNCTITVNIKDNNIQTNKIVIYPNPSNGKFTISNELILEKIEIFDILGNKVYEDEPKVQIAQINTNLPKGLYIYRVKLSDCSFRSGKISVH